MKQIEVFRLRDVVGNVPACTQCILTPLSDKCDAAKCTSQGKPMAVSQVTYEPESPQSQAHETSACPPMFSPHWMWKAWADKVVQVQPSEFDKARKQAELAKAYGGIAPKPPSVDLNAILRERLGSPVAKTPATQQPEKARITQFHPALAAPYGESYTAAIAEQLRNGLVSGDTAWLYDLPVTAYLCGKAVHYSVALTGEFWKFTTVKCETAEQAIEVCQKGYRELQYHHASHYGRNLTYKEFMSCV